MTSKVDSVNDCASILLVEDDDRLAAVVKRGFEERGFAVQHAKDGDAALVALKENAFDACVLDIRLPGRDGFTVLADARAAGIVTPVLILTAVEGVADRVHGLELGADDYLVKPFAFTELIARIRAIVRRRGPKRPGPLSWPPLTLDVREHVVTRGSETIELSAKQFALLQTLMRYGREVVPRSLLLADVFGYHFDPGTNIVDVHMVQLRKRIDVPGESSLVETVRGVGYRMSVQRIGA